MLCMKDGIGLVAEKIRKWPKSAPKVGFAGILNDSCCLTVV